MKMIRLPLLALAALAALSPALAPALAQEPVTALTQQNKVRVIGSDGTDSSISVPPPSDVERYCSNIADPARDARVALQTKRLKELEAEVDGRIDELEAKRAEYQAWLQQRQAFLDSTSSIMLEIYSTMRPDAAAAQLAGLDRTAAASIVAKLKSRQASAILAEMPAPVASELGMLIVNKVERPLEADAGSDEVRS